MALRINFLHTQSENIQHVTYCLFPILLSDGPLNIAVAMHEGAIIYVGLTDKLHVFKHYVLKHFPKALFNENECVKSYLMWSKIFDLQHDTSCDVMITGTAFQCQVWQFLTTLKTGEIVTYGQCAKRIGKHMSYARAVGQAVGANPISLLIPCHRVVPAQAHGKVGNYLWGSPLKTRLLHLERSIIMHSEFVDL